MALAAGKGLCRLMRLRTWLQKLVSYNTPYRHFRSARPCVNREKRVVGNQKGVARHVLMSKNAAMRPWISAVVIVASCAGAEPPTEWIETQTGHRVVRLSREPGTSSLYFHQNPFTAKGDKCLVTTPTGLATVDLNTHALEPLTEGRGSHLVVGKKSRQVFYVREGVVYATHLDTKATREIASFSSELRRGSGFGVNA